MTTIDELTAIREIEVLKAGYCRTIDRKDWDGLGALFTVDAQLHHGDRTIIGARRDRRRDQLDHR